MKPALSALVLSLVLSPAVQAQESETPFRVTSTDSLRATIVAPPHADSVRPSHAVRNGAIAGTVVGAVSGGYAASLIGFGCKLTAPAPPCHANRESAKAIVLGTVLGGLTLGLVGAGLGKMWRWLN